MTKEEFKTIFNSVIKEFNDNHDVDIAIVIVDTKTRESKVFGAMCPRHGVTAASALVQSLDSMIEELMNATEKNNIVDKVADNILKSYPSQMEGEKGN